MRPWLLFDLDGPLLDVSDKYYRVHADIVRGMGGVPVGPDVYWQGKRDKVPEEDVLTREHVVDAALYAVRRKSLIETGAYSRFDRVWPEVPGMLDMLTAHWRLALVTLRSSRENLAWELDHFGLAPRFDLVLSESHDRPATGRHQLKVELVRRELKGESIKWIIGDTETDILAGRDLGLCTAAVTFGIRTGERLRKHSPDVLLQTPHDMAQWAATLEKPPGRGPDEHSE